VNVVHYYVLQGDYDQALPFAEEAQRLSKLSLGEQHPTTINSLHLLAAVYDAVRPVHESLPLQLEVLAQHQHVLGEDHPRTLSVMFTTAMAYLKSDNETEALRLLETASPALQTKLGENNAESIECKIYLGYAYLLADRPEEALALLEEVDRLTSSPGVPQDQTFRGRRYLAEALLRTGQQEKGVEILEQVLQLKRTHGADDPLAMADALAETAYAYLDAGMFAEAERYLRESLDLLRANTMPDNWRQLAVQSALGAALAEQGSLAEQGNREEAESLLLSGGRGLLAERVEPPYPTPLEVANAVRRVIRFYELTEQPDQAGKWRLIAETNFDFRQ
jgi:tetratricopeptide (TPR) repeat protein